MFEHCISHHSHDHCSDCLLFHHDVGGCCLLQLQEQNTTIQLCRSTSTTGVMFYLKSMQQINRINRLWVFKTSLNLNALGMVTSNFLVTTVMSWISNFWTFITNSIGYRAKSRSRSNFWSFERSYPIQFWLWIFNFCVHCTPNSYSAKQSINVSNIDARTSFVRSMGRKLEQNIRVYQCSPLTPM